MTELYACRFCGQGIDTRYAGWTHFWLPSGVHGIAHRACLDAAQGRAG